MIENSMAVSNVSLSPSSTAKGANSGEHGRDWYMAMAGVAIRGTGKNSRMCGMTVNSMAVNNAESTMTEHVHYWYGRAWCGHGTYW